MPTMQSFRLALGQFQPRKVDPQANLDVIRELSAQAAEAGAHAVCFQEQAVASYQFHDPDREHPIAYTGDQGRVSPAWGVLPDWQYELAEPVPDGPTTKALIDIAKQHNMVVMAGLHELAEDNDIQNAYVIVGPRGFIGKYHKVHLVPGIEYAYYKGGQGFPVFDIGPCRVGVLICYDNHFPEAHRILAMQGANMIVMPHVTASWNLWPSMDESDARVQARNWILTWLRARAFDNGVYCAFVNQADESGGQGSMGCSMVVNPDGHVIAEADAPGRSLVVTDIDASMFYDVRRRNHHYQRHRRPELYGPIADPTFGATWH